MKNILCCLLTLCCYVQLTAQPPARYHVLVHEIMANPPSLSELLPNSKYIELYNASPYPQDLYEWKISDGSSMAIISEHFVLQPDSFVIICAMSGTQAISVFGKTIGVSRFPALRVNGDRLSLLSPENAVIHAVQYSRSWYKNELKQAGGWSLEMIDAKNPCGGADNWKASTDRRGGTPGSYNSFAAGNPDQNAPQLLHAYATDSLHVTLVFDESLDSTQASQSKNFTFNETSIIERATPMAPFFNTVLLKLDKPLAKHTIYQVQAKNIYDCAGNTISNSAIVKTGLEEMPESGDMVINEILVNPKANGAKYVELYNRSQRIFNLKSLHIAGRNSSGELSDIKPLRTESALIFPGDFVVVTDDAIAVKQQYLVKTPDALLEIPSMPSFPMASGTVVVLNAQGEATDELRYDERWHFELITNTKGVALERIDVNQPTQDQHNWHSAAANAGYGTPTYQNSQTGAHTQVTGEIKISPGIFSPDNDGHDDYLSIHYRFPEPGYVCNITVFDARGRIVRFAVRNGLCGTEGFFRWDGLDENKQPLSMGMYILLTEVYTLSGRTKQFKQVVTLARRR